MLRSLGIHILIKVRAAKRMIKLQLNWLKKWNRFLVQYLTSRYRPALRNFNQQKLKGQILEAEILSEHRPSSFIINLIARKTTWPIWEAVNGNPGNDQKVLSSVVTKQQKSINSILTAIILRWCWWTKFKQLCPIIARPTRVFSLNIMGFRILWRRQTTWAENPVFLNWLLKLMEVTNFKCRSFKHQIGSKDSSS